MRLSPRFAVGTVLLGLLLVGCGSDRAPDRAPGDSERSAEPADLPAPIDAGECPEWASCLPGVGIGPYGYGISCAQPAAEDLGEVVGEPGSAARFDAARTIKGEPLELVVALRQADGTRACSGAEWVLGTGSFDTRTEEGAVTQARVTCRIPAVPDDRRCADGGPFWTYTDPSQDGTEGDGRTAYWLPEAVTATDAELVAGAGPRWRLEPLEVVRREIDHVDRGLYDEEVLYRVGLRVLQQTADIAVIEALFQHSYDQAQGEDFSSSQRERYTLARVGGGPGWYVTDYLITEYGYDDEGDTTFEDVDRSWAACCDLVITDLDRRDG